MEAMLQKKKSIFGDKAFYLMVLSIALPIAIQNGITNFVNLLDNLMVMKKEHYLMKQSVNLVLQKY